LISFLAFLFIFGISGVSAVTSVVNDTPNTIYVSTDGNDSWDGLSAVYNGTSGPKNSIKNAVGTVGTNGTIRIANGIYSGENNTQIHITKNMTIIGQSQENTVINANLSSWIFYIESNISDISVTIQNLTLANGSGDYGGAINNYYGILLLKDCTFSGNIVTEDGGAIFNEGNQTVINCTFINNTGSGGGAIHDEDYSEFINCKFINNTAERGGAIYNCCGHEIITGCTFEGNSANYGGAIWNEAPSILIANFNRFSGNNATQSGSAIYFESGSVDAKYNWWGSNDPNFSALTNLDGDYYNPYLIMSISADPSEIFNGMTSQVMVDLYTDSNGGNHTNESSKYPSEIPMTFTTTWGTIEQAMMHCGMATSLFKANGGALPDPNVVTVTAADAAQSTSSVSVDITLKTATDLYIKITSSNNNPKAGEIFTLTYKLGNNGPDAAKNVTVTISLPKEFQMTEISGDGNWTYDKGTNTIIWTMDSVEVGDPYLYITGKNTKTGTSSFTATINSSTYNVNTQGVTPISISTQSNSNNNNTTTVNASSTVNNTTTVNASSTVSMQHTGIPLNYLLIAVLLVIGGLIVPKRK
jgi:predicted outer membrane repeat protein